MNFIDFLIGFFLMNAMPHFVLGIWKGRILSAFGFGSIPNILYGVTNFVVSIALFLYQYGFAGFEEHSIYLGAVTMMLIYFVTGQLVYKFFREEG